MAEGTLPPAAPDAPARTRRTTKGVRVWLPIVASVAILAPLAWMWQSSRLPANISVMDMGAPDFGTGPVFEHLGGDHPAGDEHSAAATPVTDLIADPSATPDVSVDLRADSAALTIGGRQLNGFTVNGTSPGPVIRARQGDLVEVRFTNGSVPTGSTLHWHGVDVPNAMDGVAGVTQDAVMPGETFTYRFVAEAAGTYWYHSHQVSHRQVIGGLLGAIVIEPAEPTPDRLDVVAVAHTYGGIRTVNGAPGDLRVTAAPGETVRIRVINTDNATLALWAGLPVRVAAIDGTEVNQPGDVTGQMIGVGAGGRVDLELAVPDSGAARVQLSKATSVIVGPAGAEAPAPVQPTGWLSFESYGQPVALDFDPSRPDRSFEYRVSQQPGFVKGLPGVWWAINGKLYPHVPMFMVREGELVAVHVTNDTGETHPMHLHGHHALVLARNGTPASGSPWWTDSLDVLPGESYDLVFRADNPGVWMDHCHNLEHARDGMIAHLAYEGVTTPFVIGGEPHNEPE